MKIHEYERIEKISPFDLFILEQEFGTKSTRLEDIYWSMMDQMPVENRRQIWRGKNLGSEFTGEQRAAVSNGTFKGMFIGDYWENPEIKSYVSGNPVVRWRIVDFDYGYGTVLDTTPAKECLTHHVTIMPDNPIGEGLVRYTGGAYANSNVRNLATNFDNPIAQTIKTMFGRRGDSSPRITEWYAYITSAIDSNGYASGATRVSLYAELPSLTMLFGSRTPTRDVEADRTSQILYEFPQLSAFALKPFMPGKITGLTGKGSFWLQDVCNLTSGNQTYYMYNVVNGTVMHLLGSNAGAGIRPIINIDGEG